MDWKLVPEVTNGVGGNSAPTGVTTTWVLVCTVLRVHQLHNLVQTVVSMILSINISNTNKTISDGGITVDFSIIKVYTSN